MKFFKDIFPFKDMNNVPQIDELVETWSPYNDVFVETESYTATPHPNHDSYGESILNEPSSPSTSPLTNTSLVASPQSAPT